MSVPPRSVLTVQREEVRGRRYRVAIGKSVMDSLQDSRKQVLLLTPGVTGPASLQYHDEESLLASVPPGQLEQFYVTELLPRKVALDLEYARQASMLGDLHILLRTFLAILPRTSKNSN